MTGIEEIIYQNHTIATVFRQNLNLTREIEFITDIHNPFQIGFHLAPAGKVMTPHIHTIEKPLTVTSVQEVLYVLEGKIRVTMYLRDGKKIKAVTLSAGDGILLIAEGHGVEVLEAAKIFEVKQGPYPGASHAKLYVQPEAV